MDLLQFAAIKLLRYNASIAQNIAIRYANAHGQVKIGVYASRGEALDAIKAMQNDQERSVK